MSARILVVDDNATNLKLATEVLRFEGHEIAAARNAGEALLALGSFRPELVLMDLAMPGMDGLTLTRQLKAAPDTSGIPIIALTASAMKGDEERARAAGCDGYITKPIDTRNFPRQIEVFLAARALPGTSRP